MQARQDRSLRILGLVDDRPFEAVDAERGGSGLPRIGSMQTLCAMIRRGEVDQVIFTFPWASEERLLRLQTMLADYPVDLRLAPDLAAYRGDAETGPEAGKLRLLRLADRPMRGWAGAVKARRGLRPVARRAGRRRGAHGPDRAGGEAGQPRPGAVPPAAHRVQQQGLLRLQVPDDVPRARGPRGPAPGGGRRPARDPGGRHPSPHLARRAAADLQRAPRRHVLHRPAPRTRREPAPAASSSRRSPTATPPGTG